MLVDNVPTAHRCDRRRYRHGGRRGGPVPNDPPRPARPLRPQAPAPGISQQPGAGQVTRPPRRRPFAGRRPTKHDRRRRVSCGGARSARLCLTPADADAGAIPRGGVSLHHRYRRLSLSRGCRLQGLRGHGADPAAQVRSPIVMANRRKCGRRRGGGQRCPRHCGNCSPVAPPKLKRLFTGAFGTCGGVARRTSARCGSSTPTWCASNRPIARAGGPNHAGRCCAASPPPATITRPRSKGSKPSS